MSVSVCLSVCLSDHDRIYGTTLPIFAKFFVPVIHGRGSVLLWRRSDTLNIYAIRLAHNVPAYIKVAHTRLPSVGSGADPGSWQSACKWRESKPGGRLP